MMRHNPRRSSLTEQEAAALGAYVEALQSRFQDQLVDVLLFGSRARGDSTPGSDIDVLVILDHPGPQACSDARGLGFDILLAYQVFLSIRVMSKEQFQELADMDSLFYRNLIRFGMASRFCASQPAPPLPLFRSYR